MQHHFEGFLALARELDAGDPEDLANCSSDLRHIRAVALREEPALA